MHVMDEIRRYADSLKYRPDIDISKLCYLVTPEEWDELEQGMISLHRYPSNDPVLPTTRMFCYRLEIRKR